MIFGARRRAPWPGSGIRRTSLARVLNHTPGATQGITAVYNRFRYDDEKRAALDAWARHIDRLVNGATAEVVELRRAGA